MKSIIYIITLPFRLVFRIVRFIFKTAVVAIACLFFLVLLVIFLTR